MNKLQDILQMITPEVYANIKRAVEIGKWHDGAKLDSGQRELCIQALIAYEQEHLPAEERSGYINSTKCASDVVERIRLLE
ncbi:MAG: DUF1315 family protein [Pseudomonadales bacterium]